MDYSPPGSSVHGISQVRILEWVAMSFSRESSQPRDQTESPAWQADSLPLSHQGSPSLYLARTLYILEPLWNLSSKVYKPKEGKKETCSPWSWQEPLKVSKEDVKTQGWIKTKAFLLKVYRYIFLLRINEIKRKFKDLKKFSLIFPKVGPDSKVLSAAAAKLLQSCPTLCDPIDGSPPGSRVPGILQARTLEWVAISF